jgi:hypothetical protein
MGPFQIHVADEVLNDLRARLRNARWPTDTWYRLGTGHRVGLVARPRILLGPRVRLAAGSEGSTHSTTSHGHPLCVPACGIGSGCATFSPAGQQFPRLHGHAADAQHFDVVVPSLPGYGFAASTRGINYRYVSEHAVLSELGYSRYGARVTLWGRGDDDPYALDHPESVIGITSPHWSRISPRGGRYGTLMSSVRILR